MTQPQAGSETILVIDAEANVRWFVDHLARPRGYEVLNAAGGMGGLKILQEQADKIAFIVLDPQMPDMGGLEVLKGIRKNYPNIPVIVTTVAKEKKEECFLLGVEAFIQKPYDLAEFCRALEATMEQQVLDRTHASLDSDTVPAARILIVDDEQQVCEVLSELLFEDAQGVDFKVQWATSGEAALKISKEFEPDIAIVDIKMPGMWGDELIKRFKAGEGHCPRDFVIYTSITDPGQIERAKKLGHKLIAKPTDLDILLDVLIKMCVQHHLLKKVTA